MYPLPGMEKLKSQVNITFWFSGQSDILVLADVPPLLSSQENEMLIFELHSTSDDWLGWSMNSKSIHHLSPAKKMKCSFYDYAQLLMIGWAG